MFKKHQFTCPDVIYLQNRQKKLAKINLGFIVLFYGGLYAAAKTAEKRDIQKLENLANTEVPQE